MTAKQKIIKDALSAHIEKYIKDRTGSKTEGVTRSVLITREHQTFLERHDLNLSLMVRDLVDSMIQGREKNEKSK